MDHRKHQTAHQSETTSCGAVAQNILCHLAHEVKADPAHGQTETTAAPMHAGALAARHERRHRMTWPERQPLLRMATELASQPRGSNTYTPQPRERAVGRMKPRCGDRREDGAGTTADGTVTGGARGYVGRETRESCETT